MLLLCVLLVFIIACHGGEPEQKANIHISPVRDGDLARCDGIYCVVNADNE